MTIYYKKIDLPINHADFNIDEIRGEKLFEYGNNIGYFNLTNNAIKEIFDPLFKVPPTTIRMVQAKAELDPHVDNGAYSCLNYYINPQNLTTKFWKPIENARRKKGIRFNQLTGTNEEVELAYIKEDLILVDSFAANKNDFYLMNIGEIHSVERDTPLSSRKLPTPRTMIQFQWGLKMDELLHVLGF